MRIFILFLTTVLIGLFSVSFADSSHPEFYVGIQRVSPQQIQAQFPDIKNKPIFLEFKSKYCLACKKMDPSLEKILPQYPGIEKRVYDMMKDRQTHADVFNLFKPAVVPIQVYINPQGEIVNVYYDYHPDKEIIAALDCIKSNAPCHLPVSASQHKSWEEQLTLALDKSGSAVPLILLCAFLGGIITSFFPCSISMLPVMVGYMGAYAENNKKDVFFQALVFILGLATVMTILGVVLSLLGKTFGEQNSGIFYYLVGGLTLVMGLQMLGLFHIPLPKIVKTLPETHQGRLLSFYVLGLAFGLVSSPCGTPVLAAILGIISRQGNIVLGGLSLFLYAVGQGLLIMIAGLFTGFLKHVATIRTLGSGLMKISAIVLILTGLIFILQGAGFWSKFFS